MNKLHIQKIVKKPQLQIEVDYKLIMRYVMTNKIDHNQNLNIKPLIYHYKWIQFKLII